MADQRIETSVSPDDPELLRHHADLLAAIEQVLHERPQVVRVGTVLRFRRCPFVHWQWEQTHPRDGELGTWPPGNLNDMAVAYQSGHFPLAPYLRWYMGLGYSLCGITEVFGEELFRQQAEVWTPEDILRREG